MATVATKPTETEQEKSVTQQREIVAVCAACLQPVPLIQSFARPGDWLPVHIDCLPE